MKILFIGTSSFAMPSLQVLIENDFEIIAVVTQPDKPSGRGCEFHFPPVKQIASENSLKILQPVDISFEDSINEIKSLGRPDAVVVVAYGQKIPKVILGWPVLCTVNVHGSLLPKYRGAAPIQYSLINGDKITGVTTMMLDEGWDTGEMLLSSSIKIDESDNSSTLSEKLSVLGSHLLLETLYGLQNNTIKPVFQDNSQATFAPSIKKETGIIDWSKNAFNIINLIKGVTPKPGAFTKLNDVKIKIWSALECKEPYTNYCHGEIIKISNDGLYVGSGDGIVLIKELQAQSRKRMPAADYARGSKIMIGQIFKKCEEL